jgi:hypothetical protein
MTDDISTALAALFALIVIGILLIVAGFLFWWPLLLYSWNYWFGG